MSNFSRDKRLLDWPKHCPALVGEITESIADGAAHEKDHVVLSRAFTVTHPGRLSTLPWSESAAVSL